MSNPSNNILDLSNVINVAILPTPQNLSTPNINTAALFSQELPVWSGSQDYAIYKNASDVATDFGANSSAAAIAAAFFSQQPNPLVSSGYLAIIPRLTSPSLETVQAAILRTLNLVYYFGILIDEEMGANPAGFSSLAAYIQTLDKVFFYCSSDINDLQPGSILDLLRTSSENHSRALYYGNPILNGAAVQQTQIVAGAYSGRALSTVFAGSNTTQTMHLKQLAILTPDQTIAQTQLAQGETAGVDVYVSIAGVPGLFTSGANEFFDQVYNRLWLKFAIQTAGFNYLALTNTKIPQTESGMEGLKNAYRAVCQQAVANGFSAPGAWTSPDVFGDPTALIRCIKDIGFYVFSLPIAQQDISDRADRKAPLVQIAIKEAGAVHSSNVIVNVNI